MSTKRGAKGKRAPKPHRLEYEGKNRLWFEQRAQMLSHELRGE